MLHDLKLILFDMAGTTVDDKAFGDSLVIRAFQRTFSQVGLEINPEIINNSQG